MMTVGKKWEDMTPEEKREKRFQRWLSPPGVKFPTPGAEKAYKERINRFIAAIKLEEPDRVPVLLPIGFFPIYHYGSTLQKVMYDYQELKRVWLKFLHDFEMDTYSGPGEVFPGRVCEKLDYLLFKWPGHGLAPDSPSYQFVEAERMKPEDYDTLIKDPSNFMKKIFMPKVLGALEPLQALPPLTSLISVISNTTSGLNLPDVQKTFRTLADVGQELAEWCQAIEDCEKERIALGLPHLMSGGAEAPFDILGDKLRGTTGILTDMFRRPDKLQEAMEKLIPIALDAGIEGANKSGVPLSAFALHKGNDTFMSPKQFETFYWPSLKKILMGLIAEGLVPLLFAEGSYMKRLDIITDLPKGTAVWWFEQMDMARAKRVLGGRACIAGNLPASLLCTGTPQEVKAHCRQLIEVAGKGGGYILAGGAGINKGNPDNLRAIMAAAKEYGVYRK
jgi:uroporphyrinogen-III decarboxylase